MYRGLSVIATVPVFNEEPKIGKVIGRMPGDVMDEVVVVRKPRKPFAINLRS
jgi:hypothetical protein